MSEQRTYPVKWFEVGKRQEHDLVTRPTNSEIGTAYGILQAGRSMANFMLENYFIDTGIGDVMGNGSDKVTCCGASVEHKSSGVVRIFKQLKIEDIQKRVITSIKGFNALHALGEVYEWGGEEHDALISLHNNITSRELHISPVSILQPVIVSDSSLRRYSTQPFRASIVNWKNERQEDKSNKLTGFITANDGQKNIKLYFKDFGDAWYPDSIRILGGTGLDQARKFLKMTEYGALHAIEFSVSNTESVIVDNVYIYLKQGNSMKVLGYWDDIKIRVDTSMLKERADEVCRALELTGIYLNKLRFLIAPYGSIDTYKVEI